MPAHCQLVHRVVRQPGRIVAVLVPTGQSEHPLAHQVAQCVLDLPRVARVRQAGCQVLGEREPLVQGLEQDGPAICTRVLRVEARHYRLHLLLEFQGQLGYTVCRHRVSSRLCVEASRHSSYSIVSSLDGFFVATVMNYSG